MASFRSLRTQAAPFLRAAGDASTDGVPLAAPSSPASTTDWTIVSSNRNDDYLERVKAEIRAEADAARARAPLPRDDVAAPAVPARPRQDGIERNRLDYAISELTGSHYS